MIGSCKWWMCAAWETEEERREREFVQLHLSVFAPVFVFASVFVFVFVFVSKQRTSGEKLR